MINFLATSNLNLEFILGRTEFENADWTERGREKVRRKLHVLSVHALGRHLHIPYILETNPHPFHSFRGLKNQMRIRIACGLDSQSRAGFWKSDRSVVRAVRTIQ
jgi:hypothetical protein